MSSGNIDTRLGMLWDKLTRNSREVAELKPRLRTLEKRVDRLEETMTSQQHEEAPK